MEPIIISAVFDAPLDKVWNALSKEDELKAWYFPVEDYNFKVGAAFTFYESCDSRNYFHRCRFLNIVDRQLIEYSWEHPNHSKGSSVVKWETEAIGDRTSVTLTHTGTENFADAGPAFMPANYREGWDAIVNNQLRNYLYDIKKLSFDLEINAPASAVWKKLWDKDTYAQWTAPFCEGSSLEGELFQGSRVQFLAPSGEGMYSDVSFLKENELMVFKHIGMVKDRKELPIDDDTSKWTGAYEIYRLSEKDGKTKIHAEVDSVASHDEYMKEKFPIALRELKRISEQ